MRSLLTMILAMMVSLPAASHAQDQATLRRVHVMTGAGTLPRNPANRLEYLRYATTGEPRLTGAQLIERIPEVQKFARVSVESDEFIPYDQPQELKALSLRMSARLADPDISGIIFTHGTNTIEETAYFMNLTVRSDKPVVIVGAQRPFSTLSSDGPLNTHAILKEGVEVLADGSTEIAVDIGSVAVAGTITIDGASVTSKSDYGTLYFGTEAGDKIELATTTTGSYSTRVIPGTYDIFYAVGVPLQASVAPINTYGKVASGVVLAPGAPITLDIDVRTVVATGSVELDGVVVNKETDGGRLWLRTDYGDELPLGWTSAGMFSARVLPGTYQLYYEGTAPSSAAPFNKDARLGCLVVE